MQMPCPSCTRTLEYSGERPRFCSFCGSALSTVAVTPVLAPASEDRTVPPSHDWATQEAAAVTDAWATVDAREADSGPLGCGVPETVGGYRLMRRLGGGGMGAVYEAEEAASGRRVALKLVLPELAGSGDALVRFRQEGRLASAVAHPRCVFVLAADEDAGRPYIVMELMPGQTLADLVRERGPRSVEEAVGYILDVIDGLSEAHRLGLVHRDVKPSNCFLEAGGRVKVGDFGLARSLVTDSHLTRSGAFVGTPLYAAPEQIHKKDPTDAQSDVYSVAATLYFLLTGRAPFQGDGDAMAVMARIVTDAPPPLRGARRDLPRALDRVVLRGLERDRRRRYRDLDEFRRALLPFLPARPSVSGVGLRFVAEVIDWVARIALGFLLGAAVLQPALAFGLLPEVAPNQHMLVYGQPIGLLICVVYYGVLEGRWGCALGKWLLRLRVGTAASAQPPGVRRAMLRAALFYLVFQVGWLVSLPLAAVLGLSAEDPAAMARDGPQAYLFLGLGFAIMLVFALSLVANFGTMRERNGYRALHEFLSGTRTYRLRWPPRRQHRAVQWRGFELEVTRPEGLPERVGPFRVRGALRWAERERTLLAVDPQLDRAVWLWLRPASEPPLDAARRDISRSTRIRWVACGTDGPWQYDAFLAPAGMPLPVLAAVTPRLSWADVRPILDDLAEEMEASCAEGTLPRQLSPHQVWVQPDGRVQLLGTPLAGTADQARGDLADEASDAADEERALRFLGTVAMTALEGRTRPVDEAGDRVRAPLPPYASQVLDRLLGGSRRYATLASLRQELEKIHERPAEVSRLRRAAHLGGLVLLLNLPTCGIGPVMLAGLVFAGLIGVSRHEPGIADSAAGMGVFTAVFCAVWVAWAFVFRGGYLYWRGGIALRRADGRKAARWQCGLRALLFWAPIAAGYGLALAAGVAAPDWPWLYFGLWGLTTALWPLYAVLALLNPTRSLHDRIAGTYLVPA